MLLTRRYDVILEKTYAKILYLSSSCEETFCFLAMRASHKNVFVHVDSKGKVLFELQFSGPVDSFAMMRQNQCIVLQTKKDCFTVISLNDHKVSQHQHHFLNDSSAFSELVSFPQSKYICIKEKGSPKWPRLRFSYYESQNFTLICAKDIDPQPFVIQANHHSAFSLFENSQASQKFKFTIVKLEQKKIMQNIYFLNNFTYSRGKLELNVSNIWELNKDLFCIAGNEIKTDGNIKFDNIKRLMITFETKTSLTRQFNFDFAAYENSIFIDYYNLGAYFVAKSVDFIEGDSIQSPVLYISNETQELLQVQQQICSPLIKLFFPAFDGSLICESIYQNYEVEEFSIFLKRVVKKKELALHFLLELNAEFDEDLMQDVVEMIEYS